MNKIAYVSGTGTFTDDKGNLVKYPIHLLVVTNGQDELEIKLDKLNNKLIQFMFDLEKDDAMYETDNGVQCDLYWLHDKNTVAVNKK